MHLLEHFQGLRKLVSHSGAQPANALAIDMLALASDSQEVRSGVCGVLAVLGMSQVQMLRLDPFRPVTSLVHGGLASTFFRSLIFIFRPFDILTFRSKAACS